MSAFTNRQMRRHPEMFGITHFAPPDEGGGEGGAGEGEGGEGGSGGAGEGAGGEGGGEGSQVEVPTSIAQLPEPMRELFNTLLEEHGETKANEIIAARDTEKTRLAEESEQNADEQAFEDAVAAARAKLLAKKFPTKVAKGEGDAATYEDAEVGLSEDDLADLFTELDGHKGTLAQREQVRALMATADLLIGQLPEGAVRDGFVNAVSADDAENAKPLPEWLGTYQVHMLSAGLSDVVPEGAETSPRTEFLATLSEADQRDAGKVLNAFINFRQKGELIARNAGWDEGNKAPRGMPPMQGAGNKAAFNPEGKSPSEIAAAINAGEMDPRAELNRITSAN